MPSARDRRQRAIRAIREARKRRGLQRDEHVERVSGSLAQLQEQIRQALLHQPSDFEFTRLQELLREVDQHIGRWERRARGEITLGIEEAWELAPELIEAPFAAAGRVIPRVILPESLLEEMVADGVDYMSGLGPVTRSRIHQFLETGLLGGATPQQVIADIGDTLRDPGPFKVLAFRAEMVTRTEMGRVHSKAGQRRQELALEAVPEMGKEWIWSGKSRVSHRSANHQVRPVKEPFEVGGEKLMHPRAAGASAENTIGCGCESVPWMKSW